jgi:aspartyl-tRNA(Asn)/glutamyl-tRNA(Gln) amidotransferase subunit A
VIAKVEDVNAHALSAHELGTLFAKRELSPLEYAKEMLSRIRESKLNAFITVPMDLTLVEAYKSEKRTRSGSRLSLLDGVPIAIKDNISITGIRCTAGSKILSKNIPYNDSDIVKSLRRSGLVTAGTTNMHEFASGVTSVNPHWGAVRNPYGKFRIAGGSSGGSAVAVAAGLVPLAIGTDTSGSVRIPASLCGVYGLKPTYGTISLKGTFPLSPSLDHAGLFARNSIDARLLLKVLTGRTAELGNHGNEIGRGTETHRFKKALVPGYFTGIATEEVKEALAKFLDRLTGLGLSVIRSNDDDNVFSSAREAWTPVRLAEASAIHRPWIESYSMYYGEDVLEMLSRGLSVTAVEYIRAKNLAKEVYRRLMKMVGRETVLVTPTCPMTAPMLGQVEEEINGEVQDIYSILSRNTVAFNVTGFPAVSFPAFLSGEGLPIGIQLVVRPGEEFQLLELTEIIEKKYGINTSL